MCPASPQSITRRAMLMPAPATFVRSCHVHHTADRPAVNAHANLQARTLFKRATDLQRTLRRFLRALAQ